MSGFVHTHSFGCEPVQSSGPSRDKMHQCQALEIITFASRFGGCDKAARLLLRGHEMKSGAYM